MIEKVCAEVGASWEKKDINRGRGAVPQVLGADPGRSRRREQHDFWRVKEERLRYGTDALGRRTSH
ncbi:glutaredoxin family protein [Streptomyces sp. KL116D]|uniref:glutaredoxin family protein n=1 Tax=Streptomyces sp. KL116D TaxID=3045152 RepID=UPI003556D429